jgi:hypothetical protein
MLALALGAYAAAVIAILRSFVVTIAYLHTFFAFEANYPPCKGVDDLTWPINTIRGRGFQKRNITQTLLLESAC